MLTALAAFHAAADPVRRVSTHRPSATCGGCLVAAAVGLTGVLGRTLAASQGPIVVRRADSMRITIRRATAADASDISDLIAESARELGKLDYSDDVIEAALESVWGLDTQLIEDGTYFLVHADGELAACGGWSFRGTLFGSDSLSSRDATRLSPERDAARIRAFFVKPKFARRGLGSRLLAHCEQEARDAGFRAASLGATESGRRLYRTCGYVEGEAIGVALGDALTMRVIPMSKSLS